MTAIGPDLPGLETAFQGEFCGGIRGFSRWKTGHDTRQYTQRKTQSGYEFEEFETDSAHVFIYINLGGNIFFPISLAFLKSTFSCLTFSMSLNNRISDRPIA